MSFKMAFVFCSLYCMGVQRRKFNRTGKETTANSSLKKLATPKKNKSIKKNASADIVIDLKADKKKYQSELELELRKLSQSSKSPMPGDLKPMLATLSDEAFDDAAWQFELKLDGYRTLAYLKTGKVDLRSRNNNSFNKKFQAVHTALTEWKINAVVDGEVVVLNEDGKPDFNSIQLWEKKKQGQLVYYVFDLLWVEGWNIMNEPLYKRREILARIIPGNGVIRYSDHIDEIGKGFFEIAKSNSLEGIIAKKKDSIYIPDSRSKLWLKIKAEQRHEAIICGYTKKKDSDRMFSSLILGIQENKQLRFIGQTGTGFTAALQEELMVKMKPLIKKNCPFKSIPPITDSIVWLKPLLICEVKYTELTSEGVMRHASFQGLREDKSPSDLNNEEDVTTTSKRNIGEKDKTGLVPSSKTEVIVTIDSHNLKLTNLSKLYWPKEKISKGDLLNYYYSVAEYIMPYMKDRPQSLNRFPNGINGESFYHKNMGGKVEKWLNTFRRFSESTGGEPKDFLICSNTASLIYMANLGCIEMNPWHSRIKAPNYPDWCVIDLDPGKIAFEKVIETAQMVKKVLDSLDIYSYPKTSGSTGIHIYIPLGAKYNYEQSKQLAELIANMVHEELPLFTSIIRNPEKRKDKIYLDYLQNRPIQTICSPYSVRPKPGATVSTPLHWDEVKKGLKISNFTIKNTLERLKSEGDLFNGVLGRGIDLNKTLQGLSNLI
jgi:bifunctional non-homologous end joining protein LigD